MSDQINIQEAPQKKINWELWVAVLTLLGGLYVFGSGWEHRMTVVEQVSAASSNDLKEEITDRKVHDARVDAERQALWKEVRETNNLVRDMSAKRK